MNSISLIGVLASDVKLTKMPNGKSVAKFTVAVNRPYQTNGEKKADFIPIACFGKVAENCSKYLKKGSRVAVEGRLRIDSSKDDNGFWKTFTSVESHAIEFLSSGKPTDNADNDNNREDYDDNGEPRYNRNTGYGNESRNASKQMTAEDYYRKHSYEEYNDNGDLPF